VSLFLPGGVRLAYPAALLVLLMLPLLWYLWTRPRWRPVIRYSGLTELRAAAGAGPARVRAVLPGLRSLAIACLVVAAARPQLPDAATRIFAEGIAILMVVDTSSSMRDLDLSPPGRTMTRLDVVKEVFRRFVEGGDGLPGRPNDLIGMIRFARYADSVVPLTLDHKNLLEALAATQIVTAQQEDGTAIGDGLALAVERLKDLKRTVGSGEQIVIKSRIVILLTDGENNFGMVTPAQAGELAARYGIKVYTIAAGTGRNVGFLRLPLDDRDLRRIAEVTGGRHFHATDAESLRRIYEEIDKLERTRVEERTYASWRELSWPWLAAAFAALGAQMLLEGTLLRKIP
jgi:Ca-activated chloride channel family protein